MARILLIALAVFLNGCDFSLFDNEADKDKMKDSYKQFQGMHDSREGKEAGSDNADYLGGYNARK